MDERPTARDERRAHDEQEQEMADADTANGERGPDNDRPAGVANDTEARYGRNESPA